MKRALRIVGWLIYVAACVTLVAGVMGIEWIMYIGAALVIALVSLFMIDLANEHKKNAK